MVRWLTTLYWYVMALDGVDEMEANRLRRSYCFVVVMAVNEFDLNVICPTSGEFARYE